MIYYPFIVKLNILARLTYSHLTLTTPIVDLCESVLSTFDLCMQQAGGLRHSVSDNRAGLVDHVKNNSLVGNAYFLFKKMVIIRAYCNLRNETKQIFKGSHSLYMIF